MITNNKIFGSYVRQNPTYLFQDDEIYDINDRINTCCIPPVWTPLPLLSIDKINNDASIFTFQFPLGEEQLNLPIGSYLLVLAPKIDNGEDAIRPYTNVADNILNKGTFQLLCKRYDEWGVKETPKTHFLFTKTDHSYKPPGLVSNYIHNLKIGDVLHFKR